MRGETRVWVLPAVLAVICLSLPAQIVAADRVAEPYPGLFQPSFRGDAQDDHRVVHVEILEVALDGRRIRPSDVFPSDGNALGLFESLFPPHDDAARLDTATRKAILTKLTRRLDPDPHMLTVTWRRRDFHLDTGRISRGSMLARYRVSLRRGGS